MAACMDRHACMSTLPAESICVYWVNAFSCSIVLAPPASMALLNASAMSVASSRFEVNGASCCTMPVMAELVVGRPSSAALIFLMLAAASSLEYPRFFMTLGKLFIWSARPMALLRLEATTPATAPILAEKPEVKFLPACAPPLSPAEPKASCMARPTPLMDGTICT